MSDRTIPETATLAEAMDWAKWLVERDARYPEWEPNERRLVALANEVRRLRGQSPWPFR